MSEKSITSGQREKLHEMVRAVIDGVLDSMEREGKLTRGGVEKVRRSGGEFQTMVGDAVREAFVHLSVVQDLAGEEVVSTYGYMSGYRSPKPIGEQIAVLQRHFPELQSCDEQVANSAIPTGVEGYFAIPRWQALGQTYGEALERVLKVLSRTRGGKFVNYHRGQLGPDGLRQSVKKAEAMEKIASAQEGHDVLVVAGQFGVRHRGRCVHRARAVMEVFEFGMGAFEVAIMLLAHPERLAHYDDLWIDCVGDEYSWKDCGHFEYALYFCFGGGLRFDACVVDRVSNRYGSASGFIPQ